MRLLLYCYTTYILHSSTIFDPDKAGWILFSAITYSFTATLCCSEHWTGIGTYHSKYPRRFLRIIITPLSGFKKTYLIYSSHHYGCKVTEDAAIKCISTVVFWDELQLGISSQSTYTQKILFPPGFDNINVICKKEGFFLKICVH